MKSSRIRIGHAPALHMRPRHGRARRAVGPIALAAALCLLFLMCLARPAAAEDRAEAERFFRLGADAYKEGKFDAAAANFDRAYEHLKAPEIAFSAAQAHRLQHQARRLQYPADHDAAHLKRAV